MGYIFEKKVYSSAINRTSKKLADIDLNLNEFRERINNELVGNLGNFCYRIVSFVNKNFTAISKTVP